MFTLKRQNFISILIGLALLGGSFVHADDDHTVINAASEYDYPPFCIVTPDGNADGFSVELLRAALKSVDLDVEFKVGPWAEIKEELKDGTIQVLPLVGRSPEREEIYDFTFKYLTLHGAIFIRKGDARIKTLDDLEGKEIIVMKGDNAEEYVRRERMSSHIIAVETYEEAMKLLNSGKHDAVIAQRLMGIQLLKKIGISKITPVEHSISLYEHSLSFAVREGDKELLEALNEGLSIVMADGTFEHLYEKWIVPVIGNPLPLKKMIKCAFIILIIPILIIFFLREIVKRKTRETQMYSNRLRHFVEKSQLIIYNVDLEEPMHVDGRLSEEEQIDHLFKYSYLSDANDAWAEAAGYKKGKDLIGMRLSEFLPKEDPGSVASLQEFIRSNYFAKNLESFETYPSGKSRYFLNNTISVIEDNKLLSFWGTGMDITDRKKAEEKLREAESKYRTIADFTYDWEWWENPQGGFEYMSPSCECITGYSPKEFNENKSLLEDIILDDDKTVWHRHQEEASQEKIHKPIQFRIKAKTGVIRWMEHVCQPVKDEEGKFLGFRASNRDITERKTVQEELIQLREELLHTTRLSTMGELTAALAHELNQPLAAILSNAQAAQRFLGKEEPDLNEVRSILTDIVGDDNRAKEIILRLRSLVKKEEVELEELDIKRVVNEVIPLVRSDSVIKNITLRADLQENIPAILGDQIQLQQVVVNLILNGFDAMQNSDPKEMVISAKQDGPGTITVSVRDSGSGIDEENLENMFKPFMTTKKEGLGMGLVICRNIIEAHNGKMWAESNAGKGATFYFSLPVKSKDRKDEEN